MLPRTLAADRRNPLLTPDGFSGFYRRNSDSLLIFFVRRVAEPEVAMDLTAETFAQAFRSRRRFRGSSDQEATGWLYGIARHQLSGFIRRGKAERRALKRLGVEVPALSDEEQQRALALADAPRIRSAVRAAISELSEEQRQAVWLRVVDELDYREVADRLEISTEAARARVHRGLRMLAQHLAGHYEGEEMAR